MRADIGRLRCLLITLVALGLVFSWSTVVFSGTNETPNGTPCDGKWRDNNCPGGSVCGPGPSHDGVARNWCFADIANCPMPATNGLMFGNSYNYDGKTWCCLKGTGIVPGACGKTVESAGKAKVIELIEKYNPQ